MLQQVTSKQVLLQKSSKSYFPALTGIRALAAFLVYIHHFNPFTENTFLYDFTQELHIGVTIFFVLSGFLICFRYFEDFEISKKWFSKYMLNRFARIYPIYFLLTLFTFIIYFKGGVTKDLLFQFFLNLSFLKGFFNDYKFTGISQGWSLTVEECFYLTAPFIFFFYKKNRVYFLVIPIILLSIGVLLVSIFSKLDFYSFFSDYKFMFLYTFFGRCIEFMVGIGLALYLKKLNKKGYLIRNSYLTFIGVFGILFSVLSLSLLRGDLSYGLYHPTGIVLNTVVLPIFISSLFLGLIIEDSFLRKVLETPFVNLLGKSSYIFYLIHMGTFYVVISKYITSNNFYIFIFLNIISIVLYYFIEEPVNKMIRRKFTSFKPTKLMAS